MRILPRYVLSELAKVFLISLAALTLMMIILGVVREAASQNLPLGAVVRLIPYILPDALRIAVPVTLLLAATCVYGRMSGSNEIVAAKSLGISPMAILWPAYIFAFLLSLVTVWLNDVAVSWGRNGRQRVVIDSVEEIAYGMLKAQGSYQSSGFSINVKRVEGRRLILPIVSREARGNSPSTTVRADWAELETDREADVLRIVAYNATVDAEGNTLQLPGLSDPVLEIPLRDASRAKQLETVPSWMALSAIPAEKIKQKKTIRRLDLEHAATAAYQMLSGDFAGLTSREWKTRAGHRVAARGRLCRLQLEPHRRWSAGFSCLCFVWVGAPMAIRRRKSDFLAVFFLCFLPILIVYYPMLIYGIDGAKNGTIPSFAIWTGNALLLLWGGWLLRRVIRY